MARAAAHEQSRAELARSVRPGWEPRPEQILQAQRFVDESLPIPAYWLEHLPECLRSRARVRRAA